MSLALDLSELRDITGLEKLPEPPPSVPWLAWVGLVGGVLLVASAIWWWLRRRARPAPIVPPERWALTELDRLQGLDLFAAGEVERFHTLLSGVLRRYLEMRFQLPAAHQTTPEFLQSVPTSGRLSAAQQTLLQSFLHQCDLAKFARAGYSPEECQAAARMAREFVEQTADASSG
jgi:hypothetical protein